MIGAEAPKRVKQTIAVLLTGSAMGGFVGLSVLRSEQARQQNSERMEVIYQPAAQLIGSLVLGGAKRDKFPGGITEDSLDQTVENVTVGGVYQGNRYEVIARMHKKAGQPDASSTFEIIAQKFYGNTNNLESNLVIADAREIGISGGWLSIKDGFIEGDGQPDSKIDSDNLNDKANHRLAQTAINLAQIAAGAPHQLAPPAPLPEQNTYVDYVGG